MKQYNVIGLIAAIGRRTCVIEWAVDIDRLNKFFDYCVKNVDDNMYNEILGLIDGNYFICDLDGLALEEDGGWQSAIIESDGSLTFVYEDVNDDDRYFNIEDLGKTWLANTYDRAFTEEYRKKKEEEFKRHLEHQKETLEKLIENTNEAMSGLMTDQIAKPVIRKIWADKPMPSLRSSLAVEKKEC